MRVADVTIENVRWLNALVAMALAFGAACSGAEGYAKKPTTSSSAQDATQSTVPAAEPVEDCQDFKNIEFGDLEPASIEEVREAFPDAKEAADDEEWMRISVAGDWQGTSPAWVGYMTSFALLSGSGEKIQQTKKRAKNIPDDVERVDAYQYYLVSKDADGFLLACQTIEGDFPLRQSDGSVEA